MRKVDPRSTRRGMAAGAVALLAVCGWSGQAAGHGMRLPFNSWGGFSSDVLRCQRVIAYSVAQCAAGVWDRQRVCERAKLAGQTCDASALDTAPIVSGAEDTIQANCPTDQELLQLGYLSTIDLLTDVANFCRAWSKGVTLFAPSWTAAAVSAVYGPLQGLAAPTAQQIACSDAAADAVESVMQVVFRTRRQYMDRIATESLIAPDRSALLESATHQLNTVYPLFAAQLAERCGGAAFTALYGRPPDVFIADIGARADCIGGQFYIQDAVLCPSSVCGNGIVEPGEDCDDGNTNDGDACPSTCMFS